MPTFSTKLRNFTFPDGWKGSEWNRVEGSVRDASLEPGLQARLADPLWLLHRQWQLGEFKAEDAASPVEIEIGYGGSKLSTYHHVAAAQGSIAAQPYPEQVPLETVVERQAVYSGSSAWALAAEAGLHALRLLDAYGAGAHRQRLRLAHTLRPLPKDDPLLRSEDRHRAVLLQRSAIDGLALSVRLRGKKGLDVAAEIGVPETDRQKVGDALEAWRDWYSAYVSTPGAIPESWQPRRMEHGFQVSARSKDSRVTLAADEYPGGHLDWWSFDLRRNSTHGTRVDTGRPYRPGKVRAIPTPMRYAGMPADRFWEREEGRVWFGGLQGGPADLARLVVAEFATVHGDDWFLVPLAVDEGSLVRVTSVRVVDCFGRSETIEPAARIDGPKRVFRMFELDGDDGPDTQSVGPWLFVVPSLVQVDHGRVIEQVDFARDEGANVAWAIEQIVENKLGHPVRRREAWLEQQAAATRAEATTAAPRDATWRYLLQSTVPPHWIPLVPTRVANTEQVNLRRGKMQQWEDFPPAVGAGPLSDVLQPGKVLRVCEEEVPREGIQVLRRWQLARDSEGRVHLWLGRRKRVGRGERASGLRFDIIERDG